jgi:hypothetical protein
MPPLMEILLMATRKVVGQDVGIDIGVPIISKLFDNLTIEDRCEELCTDVTVEVSGLELVLFFTDTEEVGLKGF